VKNKKVYICTEKEMVVEYEHDYLRELYIDGTCKNRKYRFATTVIKKYQKRIDTLMGATCIEDLFVFNSLNFEALSGRSGFYSIRIDYHFRLEFRIRKEESENTITICTITDISNHYK
jgi:proteic killer suppression protein